MNRRVVAWGALLAVALAASASADVRLVPARGGSGPTVRVRLANGQVWTPIGAPTRLSLNPLGDMTGDAPPVSSLRQDAVLVAWERPSSAEVRLALGRDTWSAERMIPGVPHAGAISVVASTHAWLLAWNDSATGLARVWSVSADGRLDDLSGDVDGVFVQALAVLDHVFVVTLDASGTLRLTVVSWLPMPQIPPDIYRAARPITTLSQEPSPAPLPPITFRAPRSVSGLLALPNPRAIIVGSTAGLGPVPIPEPPIIFRAPHAPATSQGVIGDGDPIVFSVPQLLAVARPQLKLVSMRDGGVQVAALWWESPQVLAYVPVDRDGPTTSVTTVTASGNAAYSPALIQHALRDLAGR